MKAALSFAVGHSFPLSAHKSCGAVGIERSGGRLRGWNGRGGFLTAASLLSAFISFSASLFISISEAQKFFFSPANLWLYYQVPPLWRPPVCHTRLSSYCLSFIAPLICLITLWYQSNLTENAFGRGAEKKKTDRQWCSCILGFIHMFPAFPPISWWIWMDRLNEMMTISLITPVSEGLRLTIITIIKKKNHFLSIKRLFIPHNFCPSITCSGSSLFPVWGILFGSPQPVKMVSDVFHWAVMFLSVPQPTMLVPSMMHYTFDRILTGTHCRIFINCLICI